MNITNELFKMQDLEYRAFHAKLMPTIDIDTIIGVRIPALRKFAKNISKSFCNNFPINTMKKIIFTHFCLNKKKIITTLYNKPRVFFHLLIIGQPVIHFYQKLLKIMPTSLLQKYMSG